MEGDNNNSMNHSLKIVSEYLANHSSTNDKSPQQHISYFPTGVSNSNGLISPVSDNNNSGSPQEYQEVAQARRQTPPTLRFSQMNLGEQIAPMQPNYPRQGFSPSGTSTPSYNSTPSNFHLPSPGPGTGHSNMQQNMQHPMINSHAQVSQSPTPSSATASDSFSRPSTSSYSWTPSSTPHQSPFPSFTSAHGSPSLTSSTTMTSQHRGPTGFSPQQQHSPMQPPPYGNRVYPYTPTVPTMAAPVLSNIQNPGGQMSIVGGMGQLGHPYPHGHHAHHGHRHLGQQSAYPHHPHPHNDRPFKCDQCTQSFNRNHDLKRHKRIHLAIKPFPCGFCDKSFSRKDALKVS